ncbi:hypothetical protein AWB77_04304 [Caballeronia fortuita]|uniref:Uncharacterized protein n=1 Tax=Caballeronia fortuita TaxID=1777138 RepID=A0A158CML8_9BURK|nr:hypothetical protein AWB77_04304 [Caballeronia fortuita]
MSAGSLSVLWLKTLCESCAMKSRARAPLYALIARFSGHFGHLTFQMPGQVNSYSFFSRRFMYSLPAILLSRLRLLWVLRPA